MEKFFYEQDKDICALKGDIGNGIDREYFFSILNHFLSRFEKCAILARRNNYDVRDLLQQIRIESLHINVEYFEYSKDQFELYFIFHVCQPRNRLVFMLLSEIWLAYEQPVFCFFDINPDSKEFPINGGETLRLLVELSWKQMLNKFSGFVFFKSAEEDVVWIGKSKDQVFSFA